jgi:hypothetical protein
MLQNVQTLSKVQATKFYFHVQTQEVCEFFSYSAQRAIGWRGWKFVGVIQLKIQLKEVDIFTKW